MILVPSVSAVPEVYYVVEMRMCNIHCDNRAWADSDLGRED